MALTKYEASIRIAAIWGENGETLSQDDDGTTVLSKNLFIHHIDNNGHPTCHEACKELETIAYQRGLLK